MFQTQVNYRGLAIAAVLTKSSKLKFSSPMCLSLNPQSPSLGQEGSPVKATIQQRLKTNVTEYLTFLPR